MVIWGWKVCSMHVLRARAFVTKGWGKGVLKKVVSSTGFSRQDLWLWSLRVSSRMGTLPTLSTWAPVLT